MYDLKAFRERVQELYRRARPYDDGRRPTQRDLAEAVNLSAPELSNRLNATKGAKLTARDVKAIVRTLADWEAIYTQAEAQELLDLVECPNFSEAEWGAPPLNRLERGEPTPPIVSAGPE